MNPLHLSNKPLILAFSTSYFPLIGGAEIALREVAKRLSNDFEFQIITTRAFRENVPEEVLPEGTVYRIGTGTSIDKWLLPLTALFHCSKIIREAKSLGRPILIWGVDITQASLSASVLKRFNPSIPLVLTIQYGEAEEYFTQGRLGLIRSSLRATK